MTASESPQPPAVAEEQLVVALDGISFTDESGTTRAAFDDGAALLAMLERATGGLPAGEPIEGPYGGDSGLVRYTWDGIRVIAAADNASPARVALTGPDVNGIPLTTADGLAVGSSRADVIAAGASVTVANEDSATAEYVRIGRIDVPGTESGGLPDSVGSLFTLFSISDDVVRQIDVPADDFSDI